MGSFRGKSASVPEVVVPRLALMLSVLALVLIGLVMVYSASSVDAISEGRANYNYIIKQFIYVIVGAVMAAVVYRGIPHYAWANRLVWIVWWASIILLLLVPLIGTENYGAKRWLGIGEFTIQPSEFAKVALLLMVAKILSAVRAGDVEGRAAGFQVVACVLVPALFLYVTQSDLGTTAIIAIGVLAVLWLADVDFRIILAILGVGAVCLFLAIFGTDYRTGRMVYLDPWDDGAGGYGDGYNIIRSYYAIAEGGVFGAGLGNSHEKFQYLFASESDFIFAIISEELGMIGALLVIALFLVLLLAGLSIAQSAPDDLGRMIAGGCAIMLVFQAFLNIGCVIGVFPTTGKPLPFVSMGGSSMMSSMIMIGLIMSVSRAAEGAGVYERRREDLRVVRANDPHAGQRDAREFAYAQQAPAARTARQAPRAQAPAQASRANAPYGGQAYRVYRSAAKAPSDARSGAPSAGFSRTAHSSRSFGNVTYSRSARGVASRTVRR